MKNENGQSIIEFLVFLPLMLMIFAVITGIIGSINGSINQQKATRNYMYYRVQNDSTIPKKILNANPHLAWSRFGMYILGWRERTDGETPVAPCYKLNMPFGTASDDNCDEGYSKTTTQFIRVRTVYGLCGASYQNDSGITHRSPIASGGELVDQASCLLME